MKRFKEVNREEMLKKLTATMNKHLKRTPASGAPEAHKTDCTELFQDNKEN